MVASKEEDECMSKIVIDARMINESGIGRYLRNLISNLEKLDGENEYYLLLLEKDFSSLSFNKNFKKVRADFRWYTLAEQIRLPKILKEINPDLVHFPHFNVPVMYKGKYVVTIHDLIHQHFSLQKATTKDPFTYKIKRIAYNRAFKTAVNKSQGIFTPSDFVKNQLIKEWSVNAEKITVTPEGVEDNLVRINSSIKQETIEKVLKKYKVLPPYILYVGNAHPHKNIEGLIKTFFKLRQNYQYLQLVLVGKENYFWKRIKNQYKNDSIIYTGFVDDEELVALYRMCQLYVEPSFEEGFGIPLLEAFQAGAPVAASNVGSLKEVGKDAAIYFDPRDIDDMEEKFKAVLNNQKLRKELIVRGRARVRDFSWKKMVDETLEIYNKIMQ